MIYMMIGIPGSGKSTFVEKHLKNGDNYISRDKIRYSMINDEDNYFSKEKDVFKSFINTINMAIKNSDGDIWIDATHINKASRDKVLNKLECERNEVTALVFDIDINVCLERNSHRQGRALVPESAIINMYQNFNMPTIVENFKDIVIIKE